MQNSVEIPIFINPNFESSAEDRSDLLDRFNKYGEVLKDQTGGDIPKLHLFLGSQRLDEDLEKYTYLEIIHVAKQTRNFLSFGLRTVRKFKKMKLIPSVLISADLYFAFCATLVVNYLTKPSEGIQVSFHGSFSNSTDGRLKAQIRKRYLAFVIREATSVRVVSPQLAQELKSCFDLREKLVFVAPIPVSMPIFTPDVKRSKTIAFVGRIHHERGLLQWVTIIRQLNLIRDDFSCLIVGDGTSAKSFTYQLSEFLPRERLKFSGKLKRAEVFTYLSKIQIMLSTAPSEGFGVAIREALSAGVFVCSSRNLVTLELSNRFPKLMSTFDSEADGVNALNRVLDQINRASDVLKFREELERQNKSSLEVLIQSWIK